MQESNLDQNNISQPPPAEVKVPNSKNKLPIILIIFLFVIILFSGGYIFLGNKIFHQKLACKVILRICKDGSAAKLGPNCTQTCPEDSLSLTPTIKQDETANWKTYTNEYYSIKYPLTGKIEEFKKDSSIPDLVHTIYINPTIGNPDIQSPRPNSIRVWNNLGVEVIDSDSRDKWCSLLQKGLTGQLGCNFEGKLKETSINNYKAFKFSGGRDNTSIDVIYIPHNNYIFQLEVTQSISSENGNIKSELSNQILSTFKFTP